MKSVWIAAIALVAVAGCAAPARADSRLFTYTYDWFTPVKGEKEIEAYWTQGEGGEAEGQFEFEYGITNRWLVAPYILFSRQHGGEFDVSGWKLEQRYRFGDFHEGRLLPAAYFEVEKENGEPYELEGKFITTLVKKEWTWSNNIILEHKLRDSSPLEFAYASGLSRGIGQKLHAGVELFGNFYDKEHFFGPTVGYRFDPKTQLLATIGFPYTGASSGAVRFLFEKEWK